MRLTTLLATLALSSLLTTPLEAQRGGGGRGAGAAAGRGGMRDAWRRPDEIKSRFAVSFRDVQAPKVEDEKVAPLETIELVRAAAAANQATLLYLYDGKADEKVVGEFEDKLFRGDAAGDELNLKMRCFHLGRLDIGSDPTLKDRFASEAPLFVLFDKDGKESKRVPMVGYEADGRALEAALDKAGKGAVKPSVAAFAKKYDDLLDDLEQLLKDKQAAERDLAKAGNDKAKQKKAEKEIEELTKAEQKLLEKEKELLEKAQLPERPEGGAQAGGGRFRDPRGNTGRG